MLDDGVTFFDHDDLTGDWPGERHSWGVKVAELRTELGLRRLTWPGRIADPAEPFSAVTARLRMEAWEGLHFHYCGMELFAADREFPAGAGFEAALKAARWRRWIWYRPGALEHGGREALCVPPWIAEVIGGAADGKPDALRVLASYAAPSSDGPPLARELLLVACPQFAVVCL